MTVGESYSVSLQWPLDFQYIDLNGDISKLD